VFFSPLEQFESFATPTYNVFFAPNSGFDFFPFPALYFIFFLYIVILSYYFVPNKLVYTTKFFAINIGTTFAIFARNMLQNSINSLYFTRQYFVVFFCVFIFVLGANLIGLIPFHFTITSQIIITFGLSFFIFFAANWVAVKRHGWNYFSLFLPAGSPLVMSPLLVPIEIVSYVARVFSLSIRLFANMMAGHCLLKIIAGFAWTMLLAGGFISFFFIVPFTVVVLVTFLEIVVAFLQAYVYCLLLSIYIRDCIHLH